MQRVIDGKIYDTETAEEIGTRIENFMLPGSPKKFENFRIWTLYKTKNGRFFVEGSKRKTKDENGGEKEEGDVNIVAFSEKEALEWCELHNVEISIIKEHFSLEEA